SSQTRCSDPLPACSCQRSQRRQLAQGSRGIPPILGQLPPYANDSANSKSESSRLFSCVRGIHARGSADCSLECNGRAKPCTRNLPLQEDYCGTLRFFAVRTQYGLCSFCRFFLSCLSHFVLVCCYSV